MEPNLAPTPRPRGHGRNSSHDERRRIATPRLSTKGPLDDGVDDPLSGTTSPADNISSPSRSNTQTGSPTPRYTSTTRSGTTLQPSRLSKTRPSTQDFTYLLQPTNFHPVPANIVPPPFLSSSNQPTGQTPLQTLLANGHFRQAASSAAITLSTSTSPHDATKIFQLWHIRLACMTLCGCTALAAQESKTLGDLSSSFYRDPETGKHVVPWGLRVMSVRLQAIGFGEWRRGVMGYFELAKEARAAIVDARKRRHKGMKDDIDEDLTPEEWEVRLRELETRVADAMVEMGDLGLASQHLQSARLSRPASATTSSMDKQEVERLTAMETLVHLSIGDVVSARQCLSTLADYSEGKASSLLAALVTTCEGSFSDAVDLWRKLHSEYPSDGLVSQNLAVCLIYTGQLNESRETLMKLHADEETQSFPALTFNLATLYELCTERARDRKLEMAFRDAERSPAEHGWEGVSMDYKL